MNFRRFSKSLWATAQKCPWKADQHHNKGVRSASSPAAQLGSLIHLYRAEICGGKSSRKEVIKGLSVGADLLALTLDNDTVPWEGFEYERQISFTRNGRLCEPGDEIEFVTCILDKVGPWQNGYLVEDLKTGRMFVDDPVERHTYVLSASIAYPDCRTFYFHYYYPRLNMRYEWIYDLENNLLSYPDGTTQPLLDDLLDVILQYADILEKTPPDPNPGDHCENWYGFPCQFLGNGCPLGNNISAMTLLTEGHLIEKHERHPFLILLDTGDAGELTDDQRSQALIGVQQFKGAAKKVEDILAGWSKQTNGEIQLGDDRFGMVQPDPKKVVTDEAKIEFLRHAVRNKWSIHRLARAININKTSLSRLKKKDIDGDRKEFLERFLTDEEREAEFKKIKA